MRKKIAFLLGFVVLLVGVLFGNLLWNGTPSQPLVEGVVLSTDPLFIAVSKEGQWSLSNVRSEGVPVTGRVSRLEEITVGQKLRISLGKDWGWQQTYPSVLDGAVEIEVLGEAEEQSIQEAQKLYQQYQEDSKKLIASLPTPEAELGKE